MKRLVALVLAAVLLAGCGRSTEGKVGSELYENSCASCHGSELEGSTGIAEGPAIGAGTNTALNLSDDQIAGVIMVGPGRMPGFGRSLTPEQVQSLVDYIRSVQNG